jgi:hypothetical protein
LAGRPTNDRSGVELQMCVVAGLEIFYCGVVALALSGADLRVPAHPYPLISAAVPSLAGAGVSINTQLVLTGTRHTAIFS